MLSLLFSTIPLTLISTVTALVTYFFLKPKQPKNKNPMNLVENSPRTHGWTLLYLTLEKPLHVIALVYSIPLLLFITRIMTFSFSFIFALLLVPPLVVVMLVLGIIMDPLIFGDKTKRETKFPEYEEKEMITFSDQSLESTYGEGKIPIETAVEAYFDGKLDFPNGVMSVFEYRYDLFKFTFTMNHVRGFVKDIMQKAMNHGHAADKQDVASVYNLGNDMYEWFLDPKSMLYSCAIFKDRDEELNVAQQRKLNAIISMTQMKKGHKHLDLGCGWGTVIAHCAREAGTTGVGITLSEEQAKYARQRIKDYGVEDQVEIRVINAWDLPIEEKYDRITCLEMSEHIGIKPYQKFMHHVRDRLKDDGVFYLQIAGLRRAWQYEDLIWGLFMGKYIFPGADASCPLGWVVAQLERAGFEVQRCHNTGIHYALTIKRWYENWVKNKDLVLKKYPERMWKLFAVFLAWSTCIAFQGSSTCWMIVCTKQTRNDKSSVKSVTGLEPALDRAAYHLAEKNIPI